MDGEIWLFHDGGSDFRITTGKRGEKKGKRGGKKGKEGRQRGTRRERGVLDSAIVTRSLHVCSVGCAVGVSGPRRDASDPGVIVPSHLKCTPAECQCHLQ